MATASRSWRSTAGAGAVSVRASATPARMAAIATAITSTRMSFLCGNVPLRSGTRLLLQRRRHGQQLAPRQVARDLHRVGRVLDLEDSAFARKTARTWMGDGAVLYVQNPAYAVEISGDLTRSELLAMAASLQQ